MIYESFIRPLFFKIDAEKVHNRALSAGEFYGRFFIFRKLFSLFYNYKNEKLNIRVLNINFENPIGLGAGFDKDARLTKILPCIGFGYEEVGSITGTPCEGNPKPRLFRLPKDKSLVVNYGLRSKGADIIFENLKDKKFEFPIGINIVRANNPDIVMDVDKGIQDYLKAYNKLKNLGDYLTINISCPNTSDDRAFSTSSNFNKLMQAFSKLKIEKPVFIKLKPDFSKKEIDAFLKISDKHKFIKGFIISNLTKDRTNLKSDKKHIEKTSGSFSGLPVKEKSNELLKYVYQKTQGKYVLIGCGGIFTAEDVYEKLRLGASLVQLITGMIYHGPKFIKNLNKGLVKLLERDGFKNIEEIIGIDVK
jgi:dihydroorotate dehydrogenase